MATRILVSTLGPMRARRVLVLLTLLLGLGAVPSGRLHAQVPAFDFYPGFRAWWFALPSEQRQPIDAVLARYRQHLADQGTAADEIARQVTLIRGRRPELEADFWNRFFTVDAPRFNTAPNSFLASVVHGRPAGRALDVGMGEGRNALYLAKLGWQVTGFDPADKAVALAEQRARQLGLTLATSVAHDRDFAFGSAQWDLILLSWMPVNEPTRLVEALRPGGIVVFEGPRAWFPPNGLLKAFDRLRIRHYEDVVTEGDFFQGQPIAVLRLVAERPAE
jgi:SAM-dependent methyltransferase